LTPEEEALLYPKLLRIAEYLLEQMESFYRRFHTAIQLVGLRHFRAAKKAQTITGQRVNLDL